MWKMRSSKTSARVCPCLPSNRASSFALYAMNTCSLSHQGCFVFIHWQTATGLCCCCCFDLSHDELIPLMLRRAVQSALRRPLSTMSTSQTPMEDAIRTKVILCRRDIFKPTDCLIDSSLFGRSTKLSSQPRWKSSMILTSTLTTRP